MSVSGHIIIEIFYYLFLNQIQYYSNINWNVIWEYMYILLFDNNICVIFNYFPFPNNKKKEKINIHNELLIAKYSKVYS